LNDVKDTGQGDLSQPGSNFRRDERSFVAATTSARGKILDFCGIGRKAAEGFLEQDPVSLTQIDR